MNASPADPGYEARLRDSFARQSFMTTLRAELAEVSPGRVVIELPFGEHLLQQHGYVHAGAITSIVDSACGYAALSLMPPEAAVLSVEFKINLLAPAAGERFRAVGHVLRAGRTITVCAGEVHALREGQEVLVAAMQATMISLREGRLRD